MSYTKILKYREPTTNFESSIVDDFWRLAPSKGQLDAAYNRIQSAVTTRNTEHGLWQLVMKKISADSVHISIYVKNII